MFLISSMTWSTTVPSAFALGAVVVVVQLLGSCALPQPSSLVKFLPAVGNALPPAVGPIFLAVVALVSFANSVNRPWCLPVDCCSRFTYVSSTSPPAVAERCSVTICVRALASPLASASNSRERQTHTTFAVWCFGFGKVLADSTSCPLVHVLTHMLHSRAVRGLVD